MKDKRKVDNKTEKAIAKKVAKTTSVNIEQKPSYTDQFVDPKAKTDVTHT